MSATDAINPIDRRGTMMSATRREFLTAVAAGGIGATLGAPVFLRRAAAAEPIKVGLPSALSGSNAQYGTQAKRACELFGKEINARGGVLGRPLQFIYEDTDVDPATAYCKAQQLGAQDDVNLLTATVVSSEPPAASA